MYQVTIYTDGSCSPNPGPGGWAAILRMGSRGHRLSGSSPDSTNNRMELTAVLEGIKALKAPCSVVVVTDSQLVIGWLSLGWKRKDAKCAAISADIDMAIVMGGHTVSFEHVCGHAGHTLNEAADALANAARVSARVAKRLGQS